MMFAQNLQLESYKQRSMLTSFAAVFLALLVMAFLRQLIARQDILEGLAGIFLLLTEGAIPLIAVLFPAIAGSMLRHPAYRSMEESLPIHPRNRFLAAYFVSLAYCAFLTGIIYVGAVVTGAKTFQIDFQKSEIVLLLALVQTNLLSFSLAYTWKNAFLGAPSALAISGLQLSFNFLYGPSKLSLIGPGNWFMLGDTNLLVYGIALIPTFLLFGCLILLAKNFERERYPNVIIVSILGLLLIAGPAIVFGNIEYVFYLQQTRLETADFFTRIYNPETEATLKRGGIFSTLAGDMVYLTSRGNKIRFASGDRMTYGPDASIWVLTKTADHTYTIRVQVDEKSSNYSVFVSKDIVPDGLIVHDPVVYLSGEGSADQRFYSTLHNPGAQPDWKRFESQAWFFKESFNYLIEDGKAAYPSSDKKTLLLKSVRPKSWQLPGLLEITFPFKLEIYPAAFYTEQGPGFLVAVQDHESRNHLILCSPDGSVSEPWTKIQLEQRIRIQNLPGGGGVLANGANSTVVYVLDSNGRAFEPLNLENIRQEGGYPLFRKLEGSLLWILTGKQFLIFDLKSGTRRRLAEVKPGTDFSMNSTEEGIYFVRKNKIGLMDWHGSERFITPATIN